MTTTHPTPTATDQHLNAACASVAGEIARTDSKASLLLAFDGAVLAGLASAADKNMTPAPEAAGGLAVLGLAAAAVLLLLVVRPNLGGSRRTAREGFPLWAQMEESALLESMAQDTRAAQVRALSNLAVLKYARLARAVDLILAGLALLAVAALCALVS